MSPEFPVRYTKMHGSGNDFVVIDHRVPFLQESNLASFTRAVCRRGMSIGADGVILIGTSASTDFTWRYINADGTDGEMCGNGAMVGARYAVEHDIATSPCRFETPAGIVEAEVDGARVSLKMMDASFQRNDLQFEALPGTSWDLFTIGVPHLVGVVDDVDAIDNLHQVGSAIRHDTQLQPAGANVNVIHRMDEHTIRMRTYERGVEAETLACGTGSVCSAISAARRGLVQQPVSVRVSSGLDLQVSWDDDGDSATNISLSGHARIVASGEILPDALV